MATVLRRLIASRSAAVALAARRAELVAVPSRRLFSSEPTIRRPKPIKVKKNEARRRVEPKPKAEESDALVEQQEYSQVPAQYNQGPFSPQQTPQTFGGMMKESFLWGIGISLAFVFVGVIFGGMEEAEEHGKYDGSIVIPAEDKDGESPNRASN